MGISSGPGTFGSGGAGTSIGGPCGGVRIGGGASFGGCGDGRSSGSTGGTSVGFFSVPANCIGTVGRSGGSFGESVGRAGGSSMGTGASAGGICAGGRRCPGRSSFGLGGGGSFVGIGSSGSSVIMTAA